MTQQKLWVDKLCYAKGIHKEYSFVRAVHCSLEKGHEGRHIAYYNHIPNESPSGDGKFDFQWVENKIGEVGGHNGGLNYTWIDDSLFK